MTKAPVKSEQVSVGTPAAVTGRTQWDALVDSLRLLGNAAPYLIIVGLVLFGFYKFQELGQQRDVDLQKARETATESYRLQLSAANKALVDTYQAMGGISGTQIKNLSEMLELHAKATTRTQEMQQALEQQRVKFEEALRDADLAGNQKSRVEGELKEIQSKVLRDKVELERLETALKEGRSNLTDSAVQVGAVRDKMIELAKAVRANEAAAASRQAAEILKENSDPIDIKPDKLDANVLKALIGRSDADTVADLVKNAAFVLRRTDGLARRGEAGDKSTSSRILAGKNANGGLFRDVTQLDSDGSRIVSAGVASIFGTIAPDEDDWYSLSKSIVIHSEHSSSGMTPPQGKDQWSLEDISGKEMIKDYPGKLPFLTLDQLLKEAPDLFEWFTNSAFGELQYGMAERAKKLTANLLLSSQKAGDLSGMPTDLREAVVRLVDAAVKHQTETGVSLVSSASPVPGALLGQLAAIVLHPDFEFTQFTASASDSAVLIGHFDYKIGGGFRKYGLARERVATLRFSRKNDGRWLLEQLSAVAKDSVSAAK